MPGMSKNVEFDGGDHIKKEEAKAKRFKSNQLLFERTDYVSIVCGLG